MVRSIIKESYDTTPKDAPLSLKSEEWFRVFFASSITSKSNRKESYRNFFLIALFSFLLSCYLIIAVSFLQETVSKNETHGYNNQTDSVSTTEIHVSTLRFSNTKMLRVVSKSEISSRTIYKNILST